jgi:hypothetical protein
MISMTKSEKQELQIRKTKGMYMRQGCVLFYPTDDPIPASMRKDKIGVVAKSPAIGVHKLADRSTAEVFSTGEQRFLQVGKRGAIIVHENHPPKKLEAGTYRIEIVAEDNILFKIQRHRAAESQRNAKLGIKVKDKLDSVRIGNRLLVVDDSDRYYLIPMELEGAFIKWVNLPYGEGEGEFSEHDDDFAEYRIQPPSSCPN